MTQGQFKLNKFEFIVFLLLDWLLYEVCKTQSKELFTREVVSISYEGNYYTTNASICIYIYIYIYIYREREREA